MRVDDGCFAVFPAVSLAFTFLRVNLQPSVNDTASLMSSKTFPVKQCHSRWLRSGKVRLLSRFANWLAL